LVTANFSAPKCTVQRFSMCLVEEKMVCKLQTVDKGKNGVNYKWTTITNLHS